MGFPAERRGFTPHLTIGRVRDQASLGEQQRLGDIIKTARVEPVKAFTVNTVHFIKSQLTPQGPVYSELAVVPLR